eukprot:scaffold1894_cov180-Cylindrotheca_fusiformis.AAC.1
MDSRVKSINPDKRSKKRIKFTSPKQRAKRASADVYRSYKRKIGVTSAATREERVHNPKGIDRAKKRHRSSHYPLDDSNRSAIAKISTDDNGDTDDLGIEIDVSSTFAEELDVALDRNASEVFSKFHREIWRLVRSLPEILHHSEHIIDLMLSYMLSPASLPERPSNLTDENVRSTRTDFIVNHATTDILHLLAVLARDLRHEIHRHLYGKILPRIIFDLLNPPPPPPDSGKQPIPLDATIVEAAFRTISYICRYDPDVMNDELESIRKYYGATLANRRELVRRLAAETFAPLVRKMNQHSARQRHLKRVLKALGVAEDQPVSHQSKRMQMNAVDGISQLVLQIIRGVPGKLHSQGHQTLKFVLSFCTKRGVLLKTSCGGLIFSVATTVLKNLCESLDDTTLTPIVENIVCLVKESVLSFSSKNEGCDNSNFRPVMNSLKLVTQISARPDSQTLYQNSSNLQDLFDSVVVLCRADIFLSIPSDLRNEALTHLCALWKALQSDPGAASWIIECLRQLLGHDGKELQFIAEIISKEFVSHLTESPILTEARRVILVAASSIVKDDPDAALLVTFSVASRMDRKHEDDNDSSGSINDLFFSAKPTQCILPATEQENLMSCFLVNLQGENCTRDSVARVIIALRCAPFVMLLSRDEETGEPSKTNFEKTLEWILGVLNWLGGNLSSRAVDGELSKSITIAKSVALEALSYVSLEHLNFSENPSATTEFILSAKPVAESLLFSQSGSLWAIRGVASFARILDKLGHTLDNDLDRVFDVLVPNLRSKSHALRLHTLEILVTYPPKYFVTNHSDLDLDGDLDEDPSFQSTNASVSKQRLKQRCEILNTMHGLEKIPVKLANERSFVAAIGKMEVEARTGRLPIVYAEAAANHMLGAFYMKFAPIWPVASRCLVTLLKSYEDIVWPAVEAVLVESMERPPVGEKQERDEEMSTKVLSFDEHLSACEKWETSFGREVAVFGYSEYSVENGEVPHFHVTDEDMVLESIWGVAQESRHTVAKKSRVIVPVFLSFLQNQYYALHQNDPDAREIALDEHLDSQKW